MQSFLKNVRLGVAALAVAVMLAGASASSIAFAQATLSAPIAGALSEATITALQAALNRQGIAVKTDGILNDETRAAIRKYQTQHHLPVTGEPDKATLDKLGVAVRQGTSPAQSPALAQVTPTPQQQTPAPVPGQMVPGQMAQGGMMMNCPMMQGAMPGMMQMMQGMMQMMQTMQMQPGQMTQTQPGQMQPMQGTMQGMMQMMQGMMQMMQMMQGEMPPRQMQPGSR